MRHRHRLVWAAVALFAVAPVAEAGNASERHDNRQEARENVRERADDARDASHVETLYRAFRDARASNDEDALERVDHRVHAYLGVELAEAHAEVDRAQREVRGSRKELRSDRREIRENRRDDAGPRERADDRRDKRDDKRDLRDDKRDASREMAHLHRLKKIEEEWSSLMGETGHKALNRKHSLILALRGMEVAEAARNREEMREDEAERKEDRRERREDRRERT